MKMTTNRTYVRNRKRERSVCVSCIVFFFQKTCILKCSFNSSKKERDLLTFSSIFFFEHIKVTLYDCSLKKMNSIQKNHSSCWRHRYILSWIMQGGILFTSRSMMFQNYLFKGISISSAPPHNARRQKLNFLNHYLKFFFSETYRNEIFAPN